MLFDENLFEVTLRGNRSTDELAIDAAFDFRSSFISQENCPSAPRDPKTCKIKLAKVNGCRRLLEVPAFAESDLPSFELPDIDHVLEFARQYPNVQRARDVVFFIKNPYREARGDGIPILYGSSSNRSLGVDWVYQDVKPNMMFGFVLG